MFKTFSRVFKNVQDFSRFLKKNSMFFQEFSSSHDQNSLFPNDDSKDEFWLGDKNLYAITRYNPSSKYAMTVFLLSEQIAKIGN